MNTSACATFTAHVGLDWADAKHDFCLQPGGGGKEQREFGSFLHRPDQIDAWVQGLQARFGGTISVALELAKGPIVYALQKYDFIVLFPVDPSLLAKYRVAFKPSRAKDDPTDAELALELMLRYPGHCPPLHPQSATMRRLGYLVQQRRVLVDDRKRTVNRLGYALKQYFPQALDWFEHRDTPLFCDFLTRWPTLQQVKRARPATLERFFHDHHVRREHLVTERVEGVKTAMPLTEDAAVIQSFQLLATTLVEQLRVLLQAIVRFDAAIAAVVSQLPDYKLFDALPGSGPTLAPRLLAAFGEQRARFQNAGQVQRYSGIAPVTQRSGKKSWVHWRWQCPTFVRQTFVEWAAQTINKSFWAGAYYQQQRAKGCPHQVAVRALAFKWIRILYRCWVTHTPYDESRYLRALQLRGSPLLAGLSTKTA
ncbi:MAG: IS110 family transposase [Rhodanobacteraceae bacterium]